MSTIIFQRDAVDFMYQLQAGSVDLIVTDPPYESLEKHRSKGTTTRLKVSKASSNKWFGIFPNDRMPLLFEEFYRVLKKNSHCYVFSDFDSMLVMGAAGARAGFTMWPPIVWDKVNIGMGYHYRRRYEFILFFEKGKRKLNDLSISNILECKAIRNGYPTEKPVPILRTLVRQSTSKKTEIVLDPFCGSGLTLEAAVREERLYLGNDISEGAVMTARKRMEQCGST